MCWTFERRMRKEVLMKHVESPLRVLTDNSLPLRLRERLWDGHGAGAGVIAEHVDPGTNGGRGRDRTGAKNGVGRGFESVAGEATLITFLAVAEQVYTQIGAALADTGLSYAGYELLEHLRSVDAPLGLAHLAACLACSRASITRLVERLEAEALVERCHDPDLGVRVLITSTGRLRADIASGAMDDLCARFAASLTADEWAELQRLLVRIP
jgi:DNA-binding MarR family transcriptional regulator